MEDIKEMQTSFIVESPYLKTCRLNYTKKGKKKFWDFLESHSSVAVMLFNVNRNVMIFVKQFRPAVFFCSIPPKDQRKPDIDLKQYKPSLGVSIEPSAGIIEKGVPKCITARAQVFSDTGYFISLHSLEVVSSYRKQVDNTGSERTLYFCEVTDDLKTGKGGGIDDKVTDVIELTISDMEKIILSAGPHNCNPTCLFGILWFLHYKAHKYQQSSSSNNQQAVAGKSN